MQSYLSDVLGRERIAEFRREADHARLAGVARSGARANRKHRSRARQRLLVSQRAKRAAA